MTRVGIFISLCVVFFSVLSGCANPAGPLTSAQFDLQGHRGARGLAPENTIPGFIRALEWGVTTLELDVVIGANDDLVVSHEPWFSSRICSHPDGSPISKDEERDLNIYTMTYDDIAKFDCGIRGNEGFPEQEEMEVAKPLLREVVREVQAYIASTGRERVNYNIEVKSTPERDGVYYSTVSNYARLLYDVIADEDILSYTTIQSFDPRALEAMKKIDPAVPIGFLVDNEVSFSGNLGRLSFVPDTYSPHHRIVDEILIEKAHGLNIKVIPWTVNDMDRMKELVAMGVDGFITDYPDRGAALLAPS